MAMLVIAVASTAASAQPALISEETFLSVTIKEQPFRLDALVMKEAGSGGRLPVAIVTHGQASEAEERERVVARNYAPIAREFARRGWLAVVVVRRGFGRSEGKQPYFVRGCRNGDFGSVFDEQTDDLEAAMAAIGRRHDADMDRVIALGVSMGGAAVLNLAARNPAGLRAVINVSGGLRVKEREGRPAPTCKADDLMPTFAALGERAKIPSLWVYAENDSFFPPDYVRQLHEAYAAKGGATQFHMFEPIGTDGHNMLRNPDGMLRWIPEMDRFLRVNKLKTFDQAALDEAIRKVAPEVSGRRAAARYHGRPTEKVLAVAPSRRSFYSQFGGADMKQVERQALEECEKRAKEPCQIVLRNFEPAGQSLPDKPSPGGEKQP
jgi:dienelactone hydrolase